MNRTHELIVRHISYFLQYIPSFNVVLIFAFYAKMGIKNEIEIRLLIFLLAFTEISFSFTTLIVYVW